MFRCPTMRSADLPPHFGGIAPFFHWPVITRARAGGIFRGSVPINSLVLIVTVSGRSVLSCRVRQGVYSARNPSNLLAA